MSDHSSSPISTFIDLSKFKPTVLASHHGPTGLMLVALDECPICHKYMVHAPAGTRKLFPPHYTGCGFEEQLKRADWVVASAVKVDDHLICAPCAGQGKATFFCYLCQTTKPTSEICEDFGDPAEFLCKQCYETVPAKRWNEATQRLRELHRYDFE